MKSKPNKIRLYGNARQWVATQVARLFPVLLARNVGEIVLPVGGPGTRVVFRLRRDDISIVSTVLDRGEGRHAA